ncbi:DUF2256 domain-containing protein [Halopseudomonas pachastrellae]|nr:DUF2256 domain-containing protein [Halopseudomonas pachastrellae]
MRRKDDLPQKLCAVCGRPFSWRRKWAACWDEVRYCSERVDVPGDQLAASTTNLGTAASCSTCLKSRFRVW